MIFCPRSQLDRIEGKLDFLCGEIAKTNLEIHEMSAELDALTMEVSANTDAEQSAIMLITKLSDMIKAAGTDPVKLQALTDQLMKSRTALAAAVVAGTPAA